MVKDRTLRCLDCGEDLGYDGDYKARRCAECVWHAQDEDEDD